MRVDVTAPLSSPVDRAFATVGDLGSYPQWLGIVRRAQAAAAHENDPGPAWTVDLGARVGPFWRTKTVRMVRAAHDPPSVVRFERAEHDGRAHSSWELAVSLAPSGDGCTVHVDLFYSGARWLPLVDRVLRDEIVRAGPRLDALLA